MTTYELIEKVLNSERELKEYIAINGDLGPASAKAIEHIATSAAAASVLARMLRKAIQQRDYYHAQWFGIALPFRSGEADRDNAALDAFIYGDREKNA